MAAIFDDQLVPDKASSQLGLALPTNWENQSQCVQTYKKSESEDWKSCERMIQKSLQVSITKVKLVAMGGI